MAEFLKPEINFDTHCGEPTFGRLSTMYDYPTKGITQASSIQKKHVNLGCITTCDWVTCRLIKLAVGGTGTFGGTVTAPTFQGVINHNPGRI